MTRGSARNWNTVVKLAVTVNDIAAIGITNQRETTVVWDRKQERRYTMPLFGRIGRTAIIAMN